MTIFARGPMLYLRRRVPRRYVSVEPKPFFVVSLHTDSMTAAQAKAPRIWADMIEAWEARLAGDTGDAEARLAAARNLAQARGFRFMGAADVARVPLPDLLGRLEAVARSSKPGQPDLAVADALLGTLESPVPRLSDCLEIYWRVAKDRALGKSAEQERLARNPRIKAMKNFIAVVRDQPITEVITDDLFKFRGWWVDRMEQGGVGANSANKDFVYVGSTMRAVARSRGLKLAADFTGIKIREGEKVHRPPFSRAWIEQKILAPGALDGLNSEARAILLGMINTGYRPSEGAALRTAFIRLDAEVPHISIEADGRQLKSQYARRRIPLLGVSLAAFRAYPDGFARYRNNRTLSATVNKFLRENGLLETEAHSLYSLRHAFEDRMLAAGIDDRIRRDLLGHTLTRERYGEGADLAQVAKLLEAVAIK